MEFNETGVQVLETLGITLDTYNELKSLKSGGSVVSIYVKVSDPPDVIFEQDTEFIDGVIADPEYSGLVQEAQKCPECGVVLMMDPAHDIHHAGDNDVSY